MLNTSLLLKQVALNSNTTYLPTTVCDSINLALSVKQECAHVKGSEESKIFALVISASENSNIPDSVFQ